MGECIIFFVCVIQNYINSIILTNIFDMMYMFLFSEVLNFSEL